MSKYPHEPEMEGSIIETTFTQATNCEINEEITDLTNEWQGDYHVEQDDETEDVLIEQEP